MKRLNDEELRLKEKMLDFLKKYPLHTPYNIIVPLIKDDKIFIGYMRYEKGENIHPPTTSRFNIQYEDSLCYLLTFGIPEHLRRERRPEGRRPHYGTKLYNCVEDFCKSEGIRFIRTTPSGDGIPFFQAMGYRMISESEAEKTI